MLAQVVGVLQGPAGMAVTVGLLAGFALVENLLVQRGLAWAHRPAIPSGTVLPPLVALPGEGGRACGVRWTRLADGRVLWQGVDRGLPRGMRGIAHLAVDRRGRVHVEVRWTPWWLPLFGGGLVAVLGALQGDGPVAGGLGALVVAGTVLAYGMQAPKAAAALRQAMVVASEAD